VKVLKAKARSLNLLLSTKEINKK